MAKFRKKPIVIEAIQWTGTEQSSHEIVSYCSEATWLPTSDMMLIDTLEGTMQVNKQDWVIKGVAGEFYPCKPDIFKQTYDLVSD